MFTLCTLNFVYSVFHVIFLPIPCLHNVVLCLLCVPLATSVYSILSFMLYFCHSFAHIVYIALLCLLCVLTPVLPGHININQKSKNIASRPRPRVLFDERRARGTQRSEFNHRYREVNYLWFNRSTFFWCCIAKTVRNMSQIMRLRKVCPQCGTTGINWSKRTQRATINGSHINTTAAYCCVAQPAHAIMCV